MEDQANPLQPIKSIEQIPMIQGVKKNVEFFLGPNEFFNNNDTVGLFDKEVDPDTFFSIESIQ